VRGEYAALGGALETKYRDIADGNSLRFSSWTSRSMLETKYSDIADSKQVY